MAAKSQLNSVGLRRPSPTDTNTIDVNGTMDQHPCEVDITNTERSHQKKKLKYKKGSERENKE
jgi:type 1 fimbria pilin